MAERAGQMRGGKARLGDQETARGLLVDPVHQSGFLSLGIAHHLQHLVDVARRAGTALHGKARRLVQHQHVVVLEQRHRLQRGQRLLRGLRQHARRLGRIEPQRRNAHALALLQPVLAVGALAVDAQLAFADDALDMGERQAGKARFEEAIHAHVVLIGGHDHGLHLCWELRLAPRLSFCPDRRRLVTPRLGKAWRRLAASRPVAGHAIALWRGTMRPRGAPIPLGQVASRPVILMA
jgi:hypothetical protein